MNEEQHYSLERVFTEVGDLIDEFIESFEKKENWKNKAREFIRVNRKALIILEDICK